jgi:two-component sensor histidine kinase
MGVRREAIVTPVEMRVGHTDTAGVQTARHLLQRHLIAWKMREDVVFSCCVVLGELVTNALTHGRSDARIRVLQDGDIVRLEVADDDTRPPTIPAPDPEALSGRGMLLVADFATSWGVDRDQAGGKTVWAEFDTADRRHAVPTGN